jgi:hypothetical protein
MVWDENSAEPPSDRDRVGCSRCDEVYEDQKMRIYVRKSCIQTIHDSRVH